MTEQAMPDHEAAAQMARENLATFGLALLLKFRALTTEQRVFVGALACVLFALVLGV